MLTSKNKEILKYFEDLLTCLLCAFLSPEFFDMNGTIFVKTHIFWSNQKVAYRDCNL